MPKRLIYLGFFVFAAVLIFLSKTPKSTVNNLASPAVQKQVLLRFALVSDSEGENDLLEKALRQAEGMGVNFVIGLGDWSSVGTVDQLSAAKSAFDKVKIPYYVTAGDHDDWDSRDKQSLRSSTSSAGLKQKQADANFKQVFGKSTFEVDQQNVGLLILDNSDIYKGISQEDWQFLNDFLKKQAKLKFVFAHKTPFHPQSSHIMGEQSTDVAKQAGDLLNLLEKNKIAGLFSGDLHFFAEFKSRSGAVKITTVGAVASERNFQGPRFGVVTVYNDYSWQVQDVEIR